MRGKLVKKKRIRLLSLFIILIMVVLAIPPPSFSEEVTWSSETRLTRWQRWDILPSIAQMKDGRVWVAWASDRPNHTFNVWYRVYDWNTWSNDTLLIRNDTSPDTSPFILQLKNETIYVFWVSNRTGNYDIFYQTSNDNGLNWSSPFQFTSYDDADKAPCVIQVDDGSIWVVWQRSLESSPEILYRIYNGSSWSAEMQLTNDTAIDASPSIAQIKDGRIIVFWHSYREDKENYEILYRIYDGSSWSDVAFLTDSSTWDYDPMVIQARNGSLWVFWYGHEPRGTWNDDLYYKVSYDNGAMWSDTVQLTKNTTNDMWPSAAQISDKRLWVFWVGDQYDNYDIYYKISSEILYHDVAITNVSASSIEVYQDENVSINIVVENEGDYAENVTVNCYVNSTLIGTQTATLNSTNSTTMVFSWDTSDFAFGVYTLKATVNVVSGESIINTDDNTFIGDPVKVKTPGDVNGDGAVDNLDLSRLDKAYGSKPEDSNWDSEADINRDGVVDILDLSVLGKNYGKNV